MDHIEHRLWMKYNFSFSALPNLLILLLLNDLKGLLLVFCPKLILTILRKNQWSLYRQKKKKKTPNLTLTWSLFEPGLSIMKEGAERVRNPALPNLSIFQPSSRISIIVGLDFLLSQFLWAGSDFLLSQWRTLSCTAGLFGKSHITRTCRVLKWKSTALRFYFASLAPRCMPLFTNP